MQNRYYYLLFLAIALPNLSYCAFNGLAQAASQNGRGQEFARQMQQVATAKARSQTRADADYIRGIVMDTADEVKGTINETLDRANAIIAERTEQARSIVGQETRAAIKEASGDIFKGLFCTTLAAVGALIMYKKLCAPQEKDGPKTKHERYAKATFGGICMITAGVLGHYWFNLNQS